MRNILFSFTNELSLSKYTPWRKQREKWTLLILESNHFLYRQNSGGARGLSRAIYTPQIAPHQMETRLLKKGLNLIPRSLSPKVSLQRSSNAQLSTVVATASSLSRSSVVDARPGVTTPRPLASREGDVARVIGGHVEEEPVDTHMCIQIG